MGKAKQKKPKKKVAKKTAIGTLRIKTNLQIVEKTKSGWKKTSRKLPEALATVKLFKANGNFKVLVDKKDPRFLKGQLFKGNPQGARISMLPNRNVLDKAFSLFAPHLTIHDQETDDHWDVLYQNKGGTYSYVYTLEKRKKRRDQKYKKVHDFEKVYALLNKKVSAALKDKGDSLAIPMYTLLKTYIRIGNEAYYKAHGHKGLTTLKKSDILINGSSVTFEFLGKDGVPVKITKRFPNVYVNRLEALLKPLKRSSFVFAEESGHPIAERRFKEAFKKYCGKEFYPHIVRSHYATSKVKEFLKKNKKATKNDVDSLFLSIAAGLGHKKFIKKEHIWKEHSAVTVNSYIQPELVEKVRSLI